MVRNSDGSELFVSPQFGREHGDEAVHRLPVGGLHRQLGLGSVGNFGALQKWVGSVAAVLRT